MSRDVYVIADTPVIRCYSTKAYLRDKSVALRCEVKAKPGLTSLYWIIDDKGTKVSEGQVIDEYWTLVVVSLLARWILHYPRGVFMWPCVLSPLFPTARRNYRCAKFKN